MEDKPISSIIYILVERFSGTKKKMLKKTVTEDGKDWENVLPYILYTYQKVPQVSDLLYGKKVQDPLDVLKEKWEPGAESIGLYIYCIHGNDWSK